MVLLVIGCEPARQVGVVGVDVSGRSVFFIREVRGQNYDSLVISATGACENLEGRHNYIYRELGPIYPYYRVANGVLHL